LCRLELTLNHPRAHRPKIEGFLREHARAGPRITSTSKTAYLRIPTKRVYKSELAQQQHDHDDDQNEYYQAAADVHSVPLFASGLPTGGWLPVTRQHKTQLLRMLPRSPIRENPGRPEAQ
jgi:hypothetical protein